MAALLSADVDADTPAEIAVALIDIETASRRVPMVGYTILARLQREAVPTDHGVTSWWKLLPLNCRISKGEANKRLTRTQHLAPHKTLQGEVLPPEWEHTAAAHRDGLIGDEHVEVIRKFFTALPAQVDSITKAQGEKSLAEAATQLDPRGLTVVAMQLLALLHPDGDEPADAAAKKAGLTLGPQQPDGLSYLRGWADPPPPQAGPVLDGQWRTKSQYTHDAFETALDLLLRSNTLGTLNGLPTTVVVTTTLQELQAGAGYAVTGGGCPAPPPTPPHPEGRRSPG